MRVLAVLPEQPLHATTIRRVRASLQGRFPGAVLEWAAVPDQRAAYGEVLGPNPVHAYGGPNVPDGYHAVAYVEGPGGATLPRASERPGLRVYRVGWGTQVLREPDVIDEHEYPLFRAQPFNRLGGQSSGRRMFPHLQMDIRPGLGPLNEFGHRIPLDFTTLENRPPNHVVVAVFGGSATWSTATQFEESWPRLLEHQLNEAEAGGRKVTVLNFGMGAYLLLDELISYLLFCHRIAPDVVVAHDGFNDLVMGQVIDGDLLNRHDLLYYYKWEMWAQELRDTRAEPRSWNLGDGPAPPNHPRGIVQAYMRRKAQFARIVEDAGGIFVDGLQPALFSKQAPTPREKAWMQSDAQPTYRAIFRNMPYLYQCYLAARERQPEPLFANVHGAFNAFGAEDERFEDMMHTTPEGDQAVASFYAKFLGDRVLPRLPARSLEVPA